MKELVKILEGTLHIFFTLMADPRILELKENIHLPSLWEQLDVQPDFMAIINCSIENFIDV